MTLELALFDFDGTITCEDSAVRFYKSLYKNKFSFLFRDIILCAPEFISYHIGRTDYVPLKRKRLQMHIGHLSESEFNENIKRFHCEVLPSIVKQSAVERIMWHKSLNHDIWIVSGSYDFLIGSWCKEFEIGVLANLVKRDKGICSFGDEDCNFNGKVARIRKEINISKYTHIHAYGDSDGDRAMMELANFKHFNLFT